jgi:hypothetical protein
LTAAATDQKGDRVAPNPSFRIKLLPSAGDGDLFTPECQAGVRAFFQQLRDTGVIAHPVAFTMDCAGASGCLVGEFVLPFAQIAGPAIGVAVEAWFQGRAGRKLRLQVGEIEVEATTMQELEYLLDQAIARRERQSKPVSAHD